MSDSEELLMASRSRRSNAGNKMQKLIDQERQELKERTANLDDDEINLLFQEDEDDEEFQGEPKRRKDEDDVFSESEDDSDGEEDEEAGERELELQERKKRKQAHRNKVPVVRKRVKSAEISKPLYEQPKAESLLLDNRRTSKRSSVVANKLQIYEKLAQAEKKREKIQDRLRQTKAKMAFVELTQEDRLRQAEETEKINSQSLTKFREEEIYKKETRIAINLRKKAKFAAGEIMLRVHSNKWIVTPLMEIEDREYWEQQLSKRHKKKKKYTRRRKIKDKDESNEDEKKQEKKEDNTEGVKLDPESRDDILSEHPDVIKSEVHNKVLPVDSKAQLDENAENATQNVDKSENTSILPGDDQKSINLHVAEPSSLPSANNTLQNDTDELVESEMSLQKINNGSSTEQSPPHDLARASRQQHEKMEVPTEVLTEDREPSQKRSSNFASQSTEGVKLKTAPAPKQVSFASENSINTFDNSGPPNTPLDIELSHDTDSSRQNSEEPGDDFEVETDVSEVYEGPEQLVGRNFVTIYSYPGENPKVHDIRPCLFGPQWAQPLNSRSDNVVTIARIFNKQEEDEWLDVSSSLIPDTSIFENFPGFGEYDRTLLTEVAEETDTKLKLDIKTPAPAGVILPNGVRKKCLITNRDCQYFDPKNGVPYADVEAYKTVQELQDPIGEGGSDENPNPQFKWFGFARGGIFLDVKQVPAKGVPDGF
ncbi:LANO_0A05468g1_1 [Lachancea nothofagi CBS 11611]|uniref:LANO_0A05468g1_1 n=1 Tax=Lachancea nothofagi CBS 11611 TaxID=1266666 RepID=A0A1G4IQY6_9SACH|nr:LANO_0A05468g1_1 [Lachancea nothofagi CBS 11611]